MSSSETELPNSTQPLPTNSDLLRELATLTSELHRRTRGTKLFRYQPYAKQREFHAAGAVHRERLLMAANQVGKTLAGACESAFHYPPWWPGKRWDRPVKGWAGSESSELTRDGVQRMLVGPPKIEAQWGTGLIPAADLMDWARRPGVPDALDGVVVKHVSGGTSTLGFKSYDQGRTRWQATTRSIANVGRFDTLAVTRSSLEPIK